MKFTSYLAALATVMTLSTVVRADGFAPCDTNAMKDITVDNSKSLVGGQTFCISVTGTLGKELSEGSKASLVMKLEGALTFVQDYKDLCNNSCSAGKQTFKICTRVPQTKANKPGTDVTIRFKGTDQSGKPAFCMTGTLTTQANGRGKSRLGEQA
ncbi:MAG: hypothetical protein J3Q66DRAFT_329254 [Benniella sp.]|nr:MAG: hypothetical protein J3Q66DRAFT_329254 [Benniella sp.]